jgi:hypothetical protein
LTPTCSTSNTRAEESVRRDNTEGYTDEQLADLNRLYQARLAAYSAQDRLEKSVRDYVAERAQVEFDALNRL